MADSFALANAFVRIRPTSDGFRVEADAQIKAALAGLDPKVRVGASTEAAKLAANDLRAYLNALAAKLYHFRLVTDDKDAQATLTRYYGRLLRLDKTIASSKLTVQGATRVQAELLSVDGLLDKISGRIAAAHVEIDDADAERRLALLTVEVTALAKAARDMKLGITDPGALATIATVQAALAKLSDTVKTIDFRANVEGITAAEQQLTMLKLDMAEISPVVVKATNRLAGMGTVLGFLGRKVELFGGALPGILAGVAVWHLLADAILETAAVLIPATVAFLAFGAAAVPTVTDITKQMGNLVVIEQATGQHLYPLSGAFTKVADAVKPQVYQIFGDALTVMNKKTGEFAILATGAGKALDTLAARASVALTTGGFSVFLRNATADLAKIGDIFANLFGSVGNLLKTLPGYAQILLQVLDNVSKGLEVITGSGFVRHVAGVGLALHGAFIYAGLGATVLGAATRGSLTIIGNLAEKAGLAMLATDALGGAGIKAGGAMLGFAGAAAEAAALPWGWIAAAAAGIGFLAFRLITAKDATQQWFAAQQRVLMAAPAVRGFALLQADMAISANRLAVAQFHLAGATGATITEVHTATGKYSGFVTAVNEASGKVAELTAGLHQQQAEARLYTYRLGLLSAMFGGVGKAQGLLIAAGITFREMMDGTREGLALLLQKVMAMVNAFSAMGQRAGILGADLNALTIAGSDQVTAMGKLNQAWDTTISIVSGGQSTFVAFEQNLQAAGKAAKTAGASMSGLNGPSLALRLAWQQAFTSGTQLIDALRMMSSISPGGFPSITRAVKDTLAQMIPLGKQTGATRAEMVSLAQEVNPNITSFKQLTAWLGNTRGAGVNLNKILEKAGIDIQDLTADAKKLANMLTSQVVSAFSAARLKAAGVDTAIRQLATDMTNPHTWGTIHADQLRLFNDLVRTGLGAKQAAALVSTLGGRLFRLPKNIHTSITETGLGNFSIGHRGHGVTLAGGGKIPGFGGGDRHPALLESGEAVVDKNRTRMLAPLFAAMGVPGFAAGGVVGSGSYAGGIGGLGPFARRFEAALEQDFTIAMEKAMTAAMRVAIQKAHHPFPNIPGGGSTSANARLAQMMYPSWGSGSNWAAWSYVAMRESGWNSRAMNPSSGALGIAQALGHGVPGGAGSLGNQYGGFGLSLAADQLANSGVPQPQIAWFHNYISSVYGSPQAAAAHEARFNWYGGGGLVPKTMDRGGWIPPGPTLMMNKTGRTEHLTPSAPKCVLEIRSGPSAYDHFLTDEIRKIVAHKGGGDVQVTFGQSH